MQTFLEDNIAKPFGDNVAKPLVENVKKGTSFVGDNVVKGASSLGDNVKRGASSIGENFKKPVDKTAEVINKSFSDLTMLVLSDPSRKKNEGEALDFGVASDTASEASTDSEPAVDSKLEEMPAAEPEKMPAAEPTKSSMQMTPATKLAIMALVTLVAALAVSALLSSPEVPVVVQAAKPRRVLSRILPFMRK